jgi:signal transduction histidine kinase
MLIGIAVSSGLFFGARRELILSLHERAGRLEADQARHVEQARDAERRRIAHEMHDVLAHRLSLLSLQAGAFELRPELSGESAAQATAIRTSAGKALEELRDVIAVLREDGETSTRPQPALDQIAALVDESRAAGMTVRADIHLPSAESIPEAVGRAAYRVVRRG